MKPRAVIPLAIGLAIGVFAIKYFVNLVKKAQGAQQTEMVQIVCAGSDIAPTVEIREPMLTVKSVPRALTPKQYFSDPKELEGRVANLAIASGLPIVPNLLAPKGTPPGLTVRIQEGFRAVSVQIDESTGVAGWIKPGSRVDVVAVLTGRSGSHTETISRVILQNIEVLAVGQDSGTSSDVATAIAKSVTLAVKPTEVPKLHLAATKGKIRLAMRSQSDTEVGAKMAQTTDDELLGFPEPSSKLPGGLLSEFLSKLPKPSPKATDKEVRAPQASPETLVAAATPRVHRVEVIQGHQAYDVVFEGTGHEMRRLAPGKQQRALRVLSGLQAVAGQANSATDGDPAVRAE